MQLHDIKSFQRIADQGDCCVLNIQDKQAKEVDSRTLDLLGRLSSQAVSADGGVYLCHRFVGRGRNTGWVQFSRTSWKPYQDTVDMHPVDFG